MTLRRKDGSEIERSSSRFGIITSYPALVVYTILRKMAEHQGIHLEHGLDMRMSPKRLKRKLRRINPFAFLRFGDRRENASSSECASSYRYPILAAAAETLWLLSPMARTVPLRLTIRLMCFLDRGISKAFGNAICAYSSRLDRMRFMQKQTYGKETSVVRSQYSRPDSNRHAFSAIDFKSIVYANSTTRA